MASEVETIRRANAPIDVGGHYAPTTTEVPQAAGTFAPLPCKKTAPRRRERQDGILIIWMES